VKATRGETPTSTEDAREIARDEHTAGISDKEKYGRFNHLKTKVGCATQGRSRMDSYY